MNFKPHYELEGRHAFLGASNYHWLNYSKEKLIETYANQKAKERGTELHEEAARLIKFKIKVAGKTTFAKYVNDAIGFHLKPEVGLYYHELSFGHADAIGFDERKKILRIHDLKTGTVVPAKPEQLRIYAALCCLEQNTNPYDISFELRIYQNGEIKIDNPEPEIISEIMKKIVENVKILEDYFGDDL